ncbi:MAG: hypothetical protein J5878_02885 [Oscillospiraceae bacterium]|nr:hypothetical protein [Oscillospiraceae bacterium]
MKYEDDNLSVQEILRPGERVIWSGYPQRHGVLRLEDLILIPFSIAFCCVVALIEASLFSGQEFQDDVFLERSLCRRDCMY